MFHLDLFGGEGNFLVFEVADLPCHADELLCWGFGGLGGVDGYRDMINEIRLGFC